MRKRMVAILVLAVIGGSLGSAQTFEEEIRQEKLRFRQFQGGRQRANIEVAQQQGVSFEEEMRQVKLEYRAFMNEQYRQRASAR